MKWEAEIVTLTFVLKNDKGKAVGGVTQVGGLTGWVAFTEQWAADGMFDTKEAAMKAVEAWFIWPLNNPVP